MFMSDKITLRKQLTAQRNAISPQDKFCWDNAINQAIVGHPSFFNATQILGFFPFGSEPDIKPTLQHALDLGKTLYLPCCNPKTCEMIFRQVRSLSELVPGAHGIPEPPPNHCEQYIAGCALCLVPGLAFDENGFRLGYGKGYYDRFLENFKGTSLGICYAALRQASLPMEPHDFFVDMVITR